MGEHEPPAKEPKLYEQDPVVEEDVAADREVRQRLYKLGLLETIETAEKRVWAGEPAETVARETFESLTLSGEQAEELVLRGILSFLVPVEEAVKWEAAQRFPD